MSKLFLRVEARIIDRIIELNYFFVEHVLRVTFSDGLNNEIHKVEPSLRDVKVKNHNKKIQSDLLEKKINRIFL